MTRHIFSSSSQNKNSLFCSSSLDDGGGACCCGGRLGKGRGGSETGNRPHITEIRFKEQTSKTVLFFWVAISAASVTCPPSSLSHLFLRSSVSSLHLLLCPSSPLQPYYTLLLSNLVQTNLVFLSLHPLTIVALTLPSSISPPTPFCASQQILKFNRHCNLEMR